MAATSSRSWRSTRTRAARLRSRSERWPASAARLPRRLREETEPLRKRARQLTLANAFGARVAALTHVEDVTAVAVDELQRSFGYLGSFVVALRPDGSLDAVGPFGHRPWRELRAS